MSRRRAAGPRAALAALLGVAVLAATGCGADVEPATTGTSTSAGATSTLTASPPAGVTDAAPPAATPKPPVLRGALAFHVRRRAQLRTAPRGRMVATIKTKTEFKSPAILAVAARKPGWVLVRTSVAKHHVGWLPLSAGKVFEQPRSIVIDLSARTLTLLHRGRTTNRYRVAIGTRATPTPRGRFAITDRLKTGDPGSDYGCCILALNAHQDKIAQGWGGGDRVAIHATPHAWTIGKRVSHGCVRATNKALRQIMRRVRLGTPVRIKA